MRAMKVPARAVDRHRPATRECEVSVIDEEAATSEHSIVSQRAKAEARYVLE